MEVNNPVEDKPQAPTRSPLASQLPSDTANAEASSTLPASAINSSKTNGMSIAALVCSFIIPLLGLLLGVLALGQIKKKAEGGKGLAFAAIIISIIHILLTTLVVIGLVFSSFSGIQVKARDTERRTDINTLHAQIEAYYTRTGYYPTFDDINDNNFRTTELKGIATEAFTDPESSSNLLVNSLTVKQYAYIPNPENCNKTTKLCTGYQLLAKLETGETYTKTTIYNN